MSKWLLPSFLSLPSIFSYFIQYLKAQMTLPRTPFRAITTNTQRLRLYTTLRLRWLCNVKLLSRGAGRRLSKPGYTYLVAGACSCASCRVKFYILRRRRRQQRRSTDRSLTKSLVQVGKPRISCLNQIPAVAVRIAGRQALAWRLGHHCTRLSENSFQIAVLRGIYVADI